MSINPENTVVKDLTEVVKPTIYSVDISSPFKQFAGYREDMTFISACQHE